MFLKTNVAGAFNLAGLLKREGDIVPGSVSFSPVISSGSFGVLQCHFWGQHDSMEEIQRRKVKIKMPHLYYQVTQ